MQMFVTVQLTYMVAYELCTEAESQKTTRTSQNTTFGMSAGHKKGTTKKRK